MASTYYVISEISYLRTCQGGYRTFGFDETVLEEALRATREEMENE